MNISSYKIEDPENSKKVNVNELIALKKCSQINYICGHHTCGYSDENPEFSLVQVALNP